MYNPQSPTVEGRGRGRGRGRGTGFNTVRGRVEPGRHSSYTPSKSPSSPQVPTYNAQKAGDIIGAQPRRSSQRGRIAISAPQTGRKLPTPNVTGGRPLPKFSDMSHGDDEPTPPPRSPPVSPRIANLPKLPPREGNTITQVVESIPVKSETNNDQSTDKETKRAEMRRKCLLEIFETEKGYIEDLETLINVFIFPMRTMAILDENHLYKIFSNVEVLINTNVEMLAQLEKQMETTQTGDDVLIGTVFTQLADYFKMYKVYCANQQTSLNTVETLIKKHTQFKKKLDVCHTDARCRGLFLQSFLIKPIQRVCKYPLLLRELIKYTPETHPDWEALQSAFSKINSVVADINEAQRQAEGLQRILDLQKMIDGIDSLVSPGRNYVKEGELTTYKSAKSKSGEKRHVFFFTDLILLTIKRGEKRFEHKLSVDLDSCVLVVIADSSYIKNAFELQPKGKSKKCILSGNTPEESNQWIKEIRGLIKNYQKKKLEEMKRSQQ